MATTYEPIATHTLGSAAASYTFSSIPSIFTDLVLVCFLGDTNIDGSTLCVINSDTGSNYSLTRLNGTGSAVASNRYSNSTSANLNQSVGNTNSLSTPTTIVAQFMNYSNSTTYKTILTRNGNTGGNYPGTEVSVNLWRSTNAITSIQLKSQSGNLIAGSTFTLYGIKAA